MTRPFLFIKPCHAEARARPENIPRKILEKFLCLRPLFKYICLTNAATSRGTGHLYMRPKNRSLWLAILICLLGGHFPARAQSHSVSAIEMAARMRRDYPFRCNISGRVFATDEFHEKPFPLAGASVRAYCLEDSATLKSTAVSFDSGHFNADIWDKKRHGRPQVRLTITYVGMDTLDCVVAAQKEDDQFGPAYAVTLDSVVLRSHPITLEETQIIAELKKTYLRGDTTVFNVDAFDMPEGTVLVQLVRRLPGLRYTDGQLTYMGRSIEEMRLNGDTFFKHDISIALKNMPNAKLKQVEVYETDRDTLDATQGKMLVMDMKTKEEVSDVLFANAEAGIADERWKYTAAGDINLYRNKGPQFSLGGEAKDLPDTESPKEKNKSQTLRGLYTQNFKENYVSAQMLLSNSRNATTSTSASNTFLPESTIDKQGESTGNSRYGSQRVIVDGHVRLGSKFMMRHDANLAHSRSDHASRSSSLTTSGEKGDTLHTNTNEGRSRTSLNSAQWTMSLFRDVADGDETGISTTVDYEKRHNEYERESHTDFLSLGDSVLHSALREATPGEQSSWSAAAYYRFKIKENHSLEASYEFRQGSDRDRTDCTDMAAVPRHVDSLSYDSHTRTQQHKLAANLVLSWNRSHLYATFSLSPTRKELSTGRDDGLQARRTYTALLHQQSLNFASYFGEGNSLTLSYTGTKDMPYDEQLIFIPDYSDPLNIRTGNPNLKSPYKAWASMQLVTLKKQMQIGFNAFTTRNATTNRVVFDQQTGARKSMPDNINGNYDLSGNLSCFTTLGNLTLGTSATYRYQHAAQFVQYEGDTEAAKSISENQGVEIGLTPSYGNAHLTTELEASYTFDHRSSRTAGTAGYKLHQYRADWKATVFIAHNWEVDTRVDWTCRKGMQMGDADGHECVWNLGLSYKVLKQQATVRLQAFDLLRSQKNYYTSFGNNTWQETRMRGKTEYVLLTFAYRFYKM